MLGQGDVLHTHGNELVRIQSANIIDTPEIEKRVKHIIEQTPVVTYIEKSDLDSFYEDASDASIGLFLQALRQNSKLKALAWSPAMLTVP